MADKAVFSITAPENNFLYSDSEDFPVPTYNKPLTSTLWYGCHSTHVYNFKVLIKHDKHKSQNKVEKVAF